MHGLMMCISLLLDNYFIKIIWYVYAEILCYLYYIYFFRLSEDIALSRKGLVVSPSTVDDIDGDLVQQR